MVGQLEPKTTPILPEELAAVMPSAFIQYLRHHQHQIIHYQAPVVVSASRFAPATP